MKLVNGPLAQENSEQYDEINNYDENAKKLDKNKNTSTFV